MSMFRSLLMTNAVVPVEGKYGVFVKSSGTVISSAMSMVTVDLVAGHSVDVYNKGVISTLNWSAGGSPTIHSGGSVNYVLTDQAGTYNGSMTISSGGYVGSADVLGAQGRSIVGGGSLGELLVSSAAVTGSGISVGKLTQSSYGRLEAYAGTVVSSALIYANHFRLQNGAVASSVEVYTGGNVSIGSAGSVLQAVNSGGNITVLAGGTLKNTSVYSSGTVNISSGGTASVVSSLELGTQIVVFNGGRLSSGSVVLGNILVSSGGYAEDLVASGISPASRGVLNLRAGGSMHRAICQRAENGFFNGEITDLVVSGGGAVAYLRSPCVASGVSVVSGTLIVSSGASALAVTSGTGAVITVMTGGYIEYA